MPPTPAPGAYPAEPLTGRRTTVELGGMDFTCRIIDVSNITTERSVSSDMVFAASANVEVQNFDEAFCLESTGSIIDATSPVTQRLIIRDKWDDEIWNGLLSSVSMDYDKKIATLNSRSPLYAFRETPVIYAGGPVTPAAALIGVSSVIGFTDYLDIPRATAADATQSAAGLTLTFTLAATDNMTFGQFLAKCCDYGAGDVVDCDGRVQYNHLRPMDPARPAIHLQECDLLGHPKISREAETTNDYAIYEAGTATVVTDAAQGNLGASSRLHNGTQVLKAIPSVATPAFAITNVAAARYLGECWMYARNFNLLVEGRPRTKIEIVLNYDHCTWIKQAQDFTLTFAREGWILKPFRMTRWVRSESKKTITLTALEWEA